MKNQVIKVLDREHGAKVIEYWKSKGVDTDNFTGCFSEKDGYDLIYYGSINGIFNNYSLNSVKVNNAEIITLPEEEELQLPREVFVWDEYGQDKRKRLLIAILPEKAMYRYVVVYHSHIDRFKNGKLYDTLYYKNMEELPKEEPAIEMTMEQVCKELGKNIKIIK